MKVDASELMANIRKPGTGAKVDEYIFGIAFSDEGIGTDLHLEINCNGYRALRVMGEIAEQFYKDDGDFEVVESELSERLGKKVRITVEEKE